MRQIKERFEVRSVISDFLKIEQFEVWDNLERLAMLRPTVNKLKALDVANALNRTMGFNTELGRAALKVKGVL